MSKGKVRHSRRIRERGSRIYAVVREAPSFYYERTYVRFPRVCFEGKIESRGKKGVFEQGGLRGRVMERRSWLSSRTRH